MRRRMNRKLVLQGPARVPDAAGGYSEVWSPLGVLWAAVEPSGSGIATDAHGVTVASVNYRIFVRAAPVGAPSRPKPGQRLLDGGRIFRVHAVTEADPGARSLVCYAEEEEAST